MNIYYYLIPILIFSFCKLSYGQTTDRFEEAVKAALNKDQYFADYDFFGKSTKDSLTIKNQFKFAETARRMHAIGLAEAAYLRVLRLDTMKQGKVDYPSAIYQVGAMKKLQGDYVGALAYFEKYLLSPPPIDNQFLEVAKKDVEDCKFAIVRTQKIDNQYEIIHLGREVNTKFNDFAPLLVDNQLYFSSLKYQKDEKMSPPRLYAKTLATNKSDRAKPIDGFNLPEKSVAHLTFTKDQQRAYYTICDYAGKSRIIRCQIYYQDRLTSTTWTEAKPLPDYINRKGFTATHPTVAYDANGKEFLYFSSDCPGGQGKMDIWRCAVKGKSNFSMPTNFSSINTKGNDLTPFYHQSTNTLYFSSDGIEGLGGFDIYFYAEGKVQHGGYPLNSSFNDTHFYLDPTGEEAYFSSSREGCLRISEYDMGCQDIFAIEFINIDMEVLTFDDFTKKELAGTKVQLFRLPEAENEMQLEGDLLVDGRTNTLDNQFQFTGLLRDARYRLIASKDGYISDTLNFNTRGITESITLKKVLYLAPDIFEMNLTALTFDEETNLPLTNCIVQLFDVASGELFIKDNIHNNDFYFDIYSQREYRLIASLIGYVPDTIDFDTRAFVQENGNRSITKELQLKPGGIVELDDFLPLTLYFDNDHPNPKSGEPTTTFNYEELYAAYYRKKGEFIAKYTEGTDSATADDKAEQIIDFFDHHLKGNYDTLGVFSETLIKYLQRGNTAIISIRGFASPLAGTDYNITLGKRRVNCLMNHFSTYRDGMLKRYIADGSLVLQEVSFGEAQAPNFISENPKDRQNSVYSPEASKERKVQIVGITIGEKSEGE